jgi:hypothetical protein
MTNCLLSPPSLYFPPLTRLDYSQPQRSFTTERSITYTYTQPRLALNRLDHLWLLLELQHGHPKPANSPRTRHSLPLRLPRPHCLRTYHRLRHHLLTKAFHSRRRAHLRMLVRLFRLSTTPHTRHALPLATSHPRIPRVLGSNLEFTVP